MKYIVLMYYMYINVDFPAEEKELTFHFIYK